MAKTVSPELLKKWSEIAVAREERERELLDKMTEAQRIGYLAAQASFSEQE